MFLAAFAASEPAIPVQGPSGVFAFGDFWGLVQQAGPLRWPIFMVLAAGLILVFAKLYELVRDGSVARPLFQAELASWDLSRIVGEVSGQRESMLATLQSTMLNVFQTRPGEGMLHDEIHNFVSFQQDQFGVFRRRMEFLSDTAGALGLMGTVWGMFTVFFQGTSDQDVILRGMGIALITTLLGLVVSIILNFSSTELSTFFEKRLEQVSKKSDELRFRLMELAPTAPAGRPSAPPIGPSGADPAPRDSGAAPLRGSAPAWLEIVPESRAVRARAGEPGTRVAFRIRGEGATPAPGVQVQARVPPGGGSLDGGDAEVTVNSGPDGSGAVTWAAPTKAGRYELEFVAQGRPAAPARVEMEVLPAAGLRAELSGNHQAAPAGTRLPAPLSVRVTDEFGNPVPGVKVAFSVSGGEGRFPGGRPSLEVETSDSGTAAPGFTLGAEPGENAVVARIPGVKDPLRFAAFGTAG